MRTYYHVTQESRLPSIMRLGLLPSAKPFYGRHLNAVFLSKSRYGAGIVSEWDADEDLEEPYDPVLLEVMVPRGMRVHKDTLTESRVPEAEAVYVTERIPPQNLRVIEW